MRLQNTRNFRINDWDDRYQQIRTVLPVAELSYRWPGFLLLPKRAPLGVTPIPLNLEPAANVYPRLKSPYYGGISSEISGHIRQPGERLRIRGPD